MLRAERHKEKEFQSFLFHLVAKIIRSQNEKYRKII